jgi:hypothetical protein
MLTLPAEYIAILEALPRCSPNAYGSTCRFCLWERSRHLHSGDKQVWLNKLFLVPLCFLAVILV